MLSTPGTTPILFGTFTTAQFDRPQGICFHEEMEILYVADTENHAIRAVNFKEQTVKTILGTGKQGKDYQGGAIGIAQAISSPWDLILNQTKTALIIAMAGTHQIWQYDLKTKVAQNFSGSGAEANLNSRQLKQAAWSQPSGLTEGEDKIWIADSESSAIRFIDLKTQETKTAVGGDSDNPRNLFRFGDRDGVNQEALLQHPLGVIYLPSLQKILVADTYNHRLKLLDPKTNQLVAFVGNGQKGFKDGSAAQFNEPSGFAVMDNVVFVADTNNHLIRCLDLNTQLITTLKIT